MEPRLIRALVSLGVPGVALGIFYLILRAFDFHFEPIESTWAAAIVILFLALVGGVTFYALRRWAPDKPRIPDAGMSSAKSISRGLPPVRARTTHSEDDDFDAVYKGRIYIKCHDIAIHALADLSIPIDDLIQRVENEFRGHPILGESEYESLPVPLIDGLFVVLSKLGDRVTIEAVTKAAPLQEIYEKWTELCEAYLQAIKLGFRKDHNVLFKRHEFQVA